MYTIIYTDSKVLLLAVVSPLQKQLKSTIHFEDDLYGTTKIVEEASKKLFSTSHAVYNP